MNYSKRKLCAAAVAFAACLTTPVALTACVGITSNGSSGENTCAVTFDAGRGTIFGQRFFETSVDRGATVAEPNAQPVPEDGFVFIGWNVTGNASDVMWRFDTDVVEDDIVLYATYARANTVTFDANGGAFADGGDTYEVNVRYGAALTAPEVVAPDKNRVLDGWYYNYEKWDFAVDTVDYNITLTAKWGFIAEIQTALAPFEYTENKDGGVVITGVKDKTVTSFSLPSVVTEIDDDAFAECGELVSAVIPDSVKELGFRIFSDCTKLKSVTLPAGLTYLPSSMFYGCTSLESIDLPDTVTSVGKYAFRNCAALKTVTLPVGVTELSDGLFAGCTALESVVFDGKITALGVECFSDCSKLAEFDIPSGLTNIPQGAFKNCKSLSSVALPESCENIGSSAFEGCDGIKSIDIGDNVTMIGSGAFSDCSALASVTFGASIERISSAAFSGCVSLTEAVIPDSVTAMSSSAFRGCTALKSVKLGSGMEMIDMYTFDGCVALREVTIGDGVKTVLEGAFQDCASLLDITIPASVTYINNSAFSGCDRLVEAYNLSTEVVFRDAKVVHTDASEASIIKRTADGFAFCELKVSNVSTGYFLIDYDGDAQNVVLPADYNSASYELYDYALSFNANIKSVELSAGVTNIKSNVLAGSVNVSALTVASGNAAYSAANNCVIKTEEKKFVLGCKASVIPEDGSVVDIGANVFSGNSLQFDGEFKIPSCVVSVGIGAFDGCDGITRTENNIVYVDKWAVRVDYDERDLIDLVVADGTVGIAGGAFGLPGNEYGVPSRIASVKLPDGLKYICRQAFYDCGSLTGIELPDGLLSIGGSAFGSCDKLAEIQIPDSVETVEAAAFKNCTALTYAKLPDGLSIVRYQMFDGCTALKTLVIPSSVKSIEHIVFGGCSGVTVYYGGDAEQWKSMTIQTQGNEAVKNGRRYYYSETEQAGFWHYGEDGKPTLWA